MEQPLILNRYRPLGDLGQGGYGSVELAWDTRIQRRVAIKRLELPKSVRGEAIPGLAEARTAAMLSHPNIVQVYDFDTDDDEAFLIMEYIEGLSLRDILDQEDRLSLDETAALVMALADSLHYAHENGVLHLDIKPENILIDVRGRIKIADFGISSISTAMGHGATLTGTLGYMPPEQLTGEPLDERTDEWSFASVIFESLAGENPFVAKTPEKSLTRIHAPYFTPITNYRGDLPSEADKIFYTALEPQPEARYPHLEDLSIDLLDVLGDTDEGRASFAAIVEDALGDEDYRDGAEYGDLGLWDRVPYRAFDIGRRVVAAGAAGVMTYLGLAPLLSSYQAFVPWAVAAVIAVVCAFVPQLGSLIALTALVIGLFTTQSYFVGVAVVLVGLFWWWFFGRHTVGEAIAGLLGPLTTFAFIPSLTPLLTGFSFSIKRALPATIAAWTFALGTRELLTQQTLAAPDTYIALIQLLGWIAAVSIVSVFCSRAMRSLAVLGTLLGAACLFAAYIFGEKLVTGAFPNVYADPSTILSIALSTILMIVVCALGSPLRSDEDF